MGQRWRLSVGRGRKRRFCVAHRRSTRMSRATRCRPHVSPVRRRTTASRGLPYVRRLASKLSLIFTPKRALSLARGRPVFFCAA